MKKFFKKIAFVSAMATVVSTMPAQSAAAAEGPQMSTWVGFYLGGDASGTYSDEAKYAKVWNWKDDYVSVSFESSNPEVATVTAKKGKITPLSVGTTTITATFTDADGETVPRTCKVTVKRNAEIVGISDASAEKLQNLVIGESYQPKVFRSNADGDVITWKGKTVITDGIRCESTAPDVFTVAASTAKVTAVEEGEGVLRLWAVQTEKPVVVNEETKETAYRPTTDVVEYKVVVKSAGILEAEQTSFTELKLTLDSAKVAANMKAEDLALTYVVGEKEETVEIASVAVAEEGSKSVIVTLKSEMLAKQDYVLTYGEQKVEFTTVASKGIVAAKQTAADTVVLTADTEKDAAAMASSIDAVKVTYLLGTNEMTAFVESVKVDDNNKKNVIVTMFDSLKKDTTYTFAYGESKGTVVGANLKQEAAKYIKISTDKALKGELTEVKVDVYDANDVKIMSNVDAKIESVVTDPLDYFVSDHYIYFYEDGKTAKVKATFDMGYDSEGKEIADLTAEAEIVSYKNADATAGAMTWLLENAGYDVAGNSWKFAATVNKIAVGDTKTLYGKYVVTDYQNNTTDYFTDGRVEAGLTWKFTSTNNAVVMVGDNAVLYPVGAGTAQIIVEKTWDGTNYTVAGVCTITVVAERTLSSLDVVICGNNKLSLDSEVKVSVNPKDQLGDKDTVIYEIELLDKLTDVTLAVKGNGVAPVVLNSATGYKTTPIVPAAGDSSTNNNDYFTFTATAAKSTVTNIRVQITAKQSEEDKQWIQQKKVVVIPTKDADDDHTTVAVSVGKTSIDMNLTSDDNATVADYQTTFTAVKNDTQGFYIADVPLMQAETTIDSGLFVEGNKDKYYATVTKSGDPESSKTATDFNAVIESDGAFKKEVNPNTTYIVRFYKILEIKKSETQKEYKPSLVSAQSITVTDSTKAVTVKVLNDKVSAATNDALKTANVLEFYRDGVKLNNVAIDITFVGNIVEATGTNTFFVKSVQITETVKTNHADAVEADDNGTFTYEVPVNRVFTIVTP